MAVHKLTIGKVIMNNKHSGIQDKKAVVEKLCHVLADTYLLYLKTQNFHWNVRGPLFRDLHKLFEEQYTELAEAIDVVAERIRALDAFAPASFAEFSKLSQIKEETKHLKAEAMIKQLISDHEKIDAYLHEIFNSVQSTGDEATADLLIERMTAHEKTIWMLKSFFE